MAVHLPLTVEAQNEASGLMVTSKNMLNPSNGEPIVAPSQDMILGCYYLTKIDTGEAKLVYAGGDDAMNAYENGTITLHTPVSIRIDAKIVSTTYGRYLFNQILPVELTQSIGYINETVGKKVSKEILSKSFDILGGEATADLANEIKNIGFKYATLSGLTVSVYDMHIPTEKKEIIERAEESIKDIQKAFWHGLVNDDERYLQTLKVWNEAKKDVETKLKPYFDNKNSIFNLVDSGARGNWGNVSQLSGMK
jgi:DNA-directed RNA polymerase subunit beta'